MTIVLLILKWIGILLLALLGLLLLAVLALIFIPVRYRVTGEAPGTLKEVESRIRLTWLFSLLRFRCEYKEQKLSMTLRIFGIPLNLNKQRKEKKPRKKKQKRKKNRYNKKNKNKKSKKRQAVTSSEEHLTPIQKSEAKNPEQTEIAGQADSDNQESITQPQNIIIPESVESRQEEDQKNGIWNRLLKTLGRLWGTITEKARAVFRTIGNGKDFLTDEINQSVLVVLIREFRYVMKHFSPRRVMGEIVFGAADPAVTGQILGGLALFPLFYRYQIRVVPDFQAQSLYVTGHADIKGHVRALHLMASAIRLLRDPNFKAFFRQHRS